MLPGVNIDLNGICTGFSFSFISSKNSLNAIFVVNIGALIITYTILGVPYYTSSIIGPKTLF